MSQAFIKRTSAVIAVLCSFVILAVSFTAQAATSMAISPTTAYVQVSETQKITTKVNKKAVDPSKCTFTTSNKSIATVSAKGVITGKKVGTATVTVKLKSNKKVVKKCKVIVKPRMTLSASKKTMYKGYTYQLTVKLAGKSYAAKNCTFTSSNKSVATVSTGGYIKAIKAGTCTITVKSKSDSKVYKKCTVTVKNNTVKTDAAALNFAKGATRTMKCTFNGANAGGGSLNFSSSNTSVATVSKDGLITAKAAGTATITAKSKLDASAKATCKVTVIAGKSFTVTPNDLPLNGYAMNFGAYNANTKTYYMLSSYLRQLETLGGGTLTLTAGTYNVPNVLYVPSNVTIKFNSGVVVNKNATTGTSAMSPSGTLFMLCAPSVAENNKTYSGYNGVHDVKFIGSGNVTINLANAPANVPERCAFVLCHCKNISFENLKMTNIKGNGHFVELDASDTVTFTNCSFSNSQMISESNAINECINIDIPDKKTGGFSQKWSSYDCTPNKNITVKGCTFDTVQTGVGTHSFTPDKYHTSITIDSCTFKNCVKYAIQSLNWNGATISNNTINGVGKNTNGSVYGVNYETKGIYVVGSKNLTINNNKFYNLNNYPMYFNGWYKSPHYTNKYAINSFTTSQIEGYANNNYVDTASSNSNQIKVIYFNATATSSPTCDSPPICYCREL